MVIMILPMLAYCQGDDPMVNPILFEMFKTSVALTAAVVTITQLVKKALPDNTNKILKIVLSWSIGIIISSFGWLFNLGFLADISYTLAFLYGLSASMAANGLYDLLQNLFTTPKK